MLHLIAAMALAPDALASRVLVVMNARSPVSVSVGRDYMKRRGVASSVEVQCQDSSESAAQETIRLADFREQVEAPIRVFLSRHPKIDFIVLTKGIPIRIDGPTGLGISGSRMSVDSYLAALDYDKTKAVKVTLTDTGFSGTAWANRYWNASERFSHMRFGGYLVTRLDGYTEDEARILVAYSLAAERSRATGSFLLDACPSFGFAAGQPTSLLAGKPGGKPVESVGELPYNTYNGDMDRCEKDLLALKAPVTMDRTDAFVTGSELIGYCSWGSNDSHYDAANYHKLRFAPGGIAETAVSTSARTFLPTTGGQSLIADLISQRATGAKGYCDEPLLQAVASPTILFDRYVRGWTLAESFYAASRLVGWEDIVVGDPICSPFARR